MHRAVPSISHTPEVGELTSPRPQVNPAAMAAEVDHLHDQRWGGSSGC